jgi:hypothetical protein
MTALIGDWYAYVLLLAAGFLPNEIWRAVGLWVSRGIDEGSELMVWVRSVATAILAGVIAQIVLVPPGALALAPLGLRIGAVAAGVAVFFAARRSTLAGVVVAEAVLMGGTYLVR